MNIPDGKVIIQTETFTSIFNIIMVRWVVLNQLAQIQVFNSGSKFDIYTSMPDKPHKNKHKQEQSVFVWHDPTNFSQKVNVSKAFLGEFILL